MGVVTVSSATGGLSHNFNTPGTAGYDANARIIKSLGIDGNLRNLSRGTVAAGGNRRGADTRLPWRS